MFLKGNLQFKVCSVYIRGWSVSIFAAVVGEISKNGNRQKGNEKTRSEEK
jgi:hypothetical protein